MKYLNHTLAMLVLVIIISACGNKEKKKEEVIKPVRYEVVAKMNAQKVRSYSGVASASNKIELSFRTSGIVSVLKAKIGQRVKKGDLLMRLDNVQAQLTYEQSISALKSAQSAMNTAKSSLERSKALYEKGSHSLSEYETAKNNFQNALDKFESAKRKKDIDQSQINYGYIYAPKSGVLAAVDISLNETVGSGQVVAILNAGDDVNVLVGLPENVINNVALGMTTEVEFSSVTGRTFTGSVIEVSPIVDSNTSTFPVKIDINKPIESIKPGMVANVTFTYGSDSDSGSNQLVVPVKAVGEDGNGNFVMCIQTSDNKIGIVKKQNITLGELTNNGFIVLKGLEEGQLIATAGLQTLLNNQKVKLQ
ncbi:efflux RND transporter periplasmic adaptor subunit [Saccharicrinis aurantiacus]|uniref:efflux RND transporter periplasmic adaptor subunit n=1 Tax=Saccharicrinis aurantiacus TaxID=1849719 RepID=UPI0008394F63|nr:efflux RND transporter periplasmic adaptor subunit [Saccharicrinis aurantiacus]